MMDHAMSVAKPWESLISLDQIVDLHGQAMVRVGQQATRLNRALKIAWTADLGTLGRWKPTPWTIQMQGQV